MDNPTPRKSEHLHAEIQRLNDRLAEQMVLTLEAREAAQWYFDSFMGAIDEMEKLVPHLGIPNIPLSQRPTIWAYAQENYPFIDITPLKTRQQPPQE